MKKKLICLTMSILMLLACVLTGCSSKKTDEEDESTVDNSAKTITMWLIAEEGSTKEAQDKVQAEFRKITKAKFKTDVVLKFCTEDEYYEKLEGTIAASQKAVQDEEDARKALRQYLKLHKGEGDTAELTEKFYTEFPDYAAILKEADKEEETGEVEEETIVVDKIVEIKYPDEKPNQVDIFYLSGFDRYMKYYNAEWLTSLSEELGASSKKLTDYISTSLLKGVEIDGGVYAIPNNVPIGKYTYMFIDRELFDENYHKIGDITNVQDLSVFLNDVKNQNAELGLTPDDPEYIVPLESTFEECIRMLCWYWDMSYVDESVYHTYYDAATGRNYVAKVEYTVESSSSTETTADGKPATVKTTMQTNLVLPNQVYKTNAEGKYVDADGNVLNYSYKYDTERYWLAKITDSDYEYGETDEDAVTIKYNAKNYSEVKSDLGSMYLVDEDGYPVVEDKRVIITKQDDGTLVETKNDENGNVRPTYTYSYNEEANFSILGTMMADPSIRTRGEINLGFDPMFRNENAAYRELYATLKDYEYQNFYGETKEGQSAAVSFVEGDAKIMQDYLAATAAAERGEGDGFEWNGKKYYVVVAEYPEATEEELYGNMYAVYANSPNLSRSMKVLTYLNTNKEMRDLLQYGVKDVHYTLNDDGTVHQLTSETNQYRMDYRKTGNCFILTPHEDQGVDAWTYAKIQNNDSLINPLLGFDFNTAMADSDLSLDIQLIDHIRELNNQALAMIDECTNKEELLALLSDEEEGFPALYTSKAKDKVLNKATNPTYNPEEPNGPDSDTPADPNGSSPYAVYYTWLTTYGYLAGAKPAN